MPDKRLQVYYLAETGRRLYAFLIRRYADDSADLDVEVENWKKELEHQRHERVPYGNRMTPDSWYTIEDAAAPIDDRGRQKAEAAIERIRMRDNPPAPDDVAQDPSGPSDRIG